MNKISEKNLVLSRPFCTFHPSSSSTPTPNYGPTARKRFVPERTLKKIIEKKTANNDLRFYLRSLPPFQYALQILAEQRALNSVATLIREKQHTKACVVYERFVNTRPTQPPAVYWARDDKWRHFDDEMCNNASKIKQICKNIIFFSFHL
jgi:hypothetical protein